MLETPYTSLLTHGIQICQLGGRTYHTEGSVIRMVLLFLVVLGNLTWPVRRKKASKYKTEVVRLCINPR